ncbi:subtilisin-like protease SBT1.9 [Camellia sinensis]|uniref:subtilisin-like protease SBT1.9 n=1 Tax=Camellia sinensis TaxID=4442 RepID=UPI001035B1DA|nr:subtilisin-like protease SBT1.9 [Camellia sinensis]
MATHLPLYVCLISLIIPPFISTLAQSDNYIIHMELSSMPKAFPSPHSWYLATIASILDNTKAPTTTATATSTASKLIYGYGNAIHGFSASLSPSEIEAIKTSPGYVSSYRDMPVRVDTTHSSQFLGLNSVSGVWPVADYGRDVIIGLVDTGIWPESKSFDDDGMTKIPSRWKGECEIGTQFNSSMCNKKLIGARFFNKGLLAKFPNLTISVNSTRDTDGHGTHTASTAAGNYVEGVSYFGYASGTVRGIAPRARVAMYKALWDEGVYTSDILAAIDQAIADGVDVMSLSLGIDGIPLYEDPIAIATFAALEKGIFVSTSAGNEGPFLESLHNGIPWVLTVAAGTIDRKFSANLTLDNGITLTGTSLYPGNSTSSTLIFLNTCDDFEELKKIGNKIVVCEDKNDLLGEQVHNVKNVNVTGGIFITNNTDIELFTQSTFPAVFLNLQNGKIVLDHVKTSGDPKGTMEFQGTSLGTKPAPKVASYSSRGPSQTCPFVLKPDLMAPGSLILASWPQQIPVVTDLNSFGQLFNNFNILSGTSMSCPHAAGIAGLLKAARPEWSPATIRSAMMTTSYSTDNTFSPIQDIGNGKPATPLAIGAGHVDPNKALDPGLVYDLKTEDYVNLLCALNYTMKQIQAIARSSSYVCSNPSLDLNYPSFIAFFNANDSQSDLNTVKEFQRTLTNVGERMTTYVSKLSPMEGLKVRVVPEKLVFIERYEKQSYKLEIEGPRLMKEMVVSGSLSWVEVGGRKHVVRSPIVATSISSEPL